MPDPSSTRWRLVLALVAFVGAGVFLVYVGRSFWFFGDEWDFVLQRDAGSFSDLMRPHSEHWSAVPIVAYRAIFSVFSLTTYIPYLAFLGVLHVTVAALVYVLLVREGAPWVFAIVVGAGVVLFGPGAENLVWAFQIGFVGSLVAFLGALALLQSRTSRWYELAASGLLVVGLMSSGLGVAAVAAMLVALLARREWWRAVRVTAIPIVLGVAWVIAYRDSIFGAHGGNKVDAILLLPRYVVVGLTAALEGILGLGPIGALLLVAVAVLLVAWALPRVSAPSIAVVAPLAMALFVLVLAGLGRSALFGIEQATASRYVHVVGVLLVVGLGASFFASTTFGRLSGRSLTSVLVVAAALIVGLNLATLRDFNWGWTGHTGPTKTAVISMVVAVQESEPGDFLDGVQPVPRNPNIDVRGLSAALASGTLRLSQSDAAEVTTAQVNDSRARMQVRWTDQQPQTDVMRAEIHAGTAIVADPAIAGCWEVGALPEEAWFVLTPVGGGSAKIVTSVAGELSAISEVDGAFAAEAATRRQAEAGSVLWLSVAPKSSAVRVDIPVGGSTSVCIEP